MIRNSDHSFKPESHNNIVSVNYRCILELRYQIISKVQTTNMKQFLVLEFKYSLQNTITWKQ